MPYAGHNFHACVDGVRQASIQRRQRRAPGIEGGRALELSVSLHAHLNLILAFHTENLQLDLHRSLILPQIINANRSHFMDLSCSFLSYKLHKLFFFLKGASVISLSTEGSLFLAKHAIDLPYQRIHFNNNKVITIFVCFRET